MPTHVLNRATGIALLLPMPLAVAFFSLHPPSHGVEDLLQPNFTAIHVLAALAYLAELLAIPGVYGRHAGRMGWLGLVAYGVFMLGTAYMAYFMTTEAFYNPFLARSEATQALVAPGGPLEHGGGAFGLLGLLASLLGPALFGLACLRARVLPRGAAWLLVLYLPLAVPRFFFEGRPGLALPYVVGPVALHNYVLIAALAWIGIELIREHAAQRSTPSRVALAEAA